MKEQVDYINPHATSTPIGDLKEIEAIRQVFGKDMPADLATKSLTGHSLGAAGVQEAIYSLLMMKNGFICESANIDDLDPAFADMPIVRERRTSAITRRCRTASVSAAPTPHSYFFCRLESSEKRGSACGFNPLTRSKIYGNNKRYR